MVEQRATVRANGITEVLESKQLPGSPESKTAIFTTGRLLFQGRERYTSRCSPRWSYRSLLMSSR